MNWQEELKKKAEQLNLKEEKNDVPVKTDSSLRSGSDSGRRGNVNLSNLWKKINKGGNRMISAEAAKGDILKLIDEAKAVTAIGAATVIVLKAILVAVKVILTTRTNTKEIMLKLGIPLEKKETKKSITTENLDTTTLEE